MGLRRDHSATGSGDASDDDRVLERFKPTTGIFIGYVGLVVAAVTLFYSTFYVHSVVGLRLSIAAVLAAVIIWVTQLRPRVTAYVERLHLKGSLRDAHVPYPLIDEVTLGQTLNVWVGDKRYVCIGIGQSFVADARQRAKKQKQSSLLGTSRTQEFSEKADRAAPDQTAMSYTTFVVTRIEEIVDKAKRDLKARGGTTDGLQVTRPWAVPETAALVVSALAFVASLFV
jgi:hypothetical protein